MKSIKQSLTKILEDIKTCLPERLEVHGAGQFEGYSIGYPVDPEKVLLCVRFAAESDDVNETLEFDIHAQFPGTSELDAYSYMDAVNDYLDNYFDPHIAGYTDGSYSVGATDNPRTSILEVFWSVKLTTPKDDCDF
jgi:hypothetical protein